MNLSPASIEALSRALDDPDPDREHFLNLEDGSIWTFVFSEATDETRARFDRICGEDSTAWARIPSRSSQDAFEEMEDFVEGLPDGEVKDRLFGLLEGKGAFRSFREFLLENSAERALWEEFRAERSARRLGALLESLESRSGSPSGVKS